MKTMRRIFNGTAYAALAVAAIYFGAWSDSLMVVRTAFYWWCIAGLAVCGAILAFIWGFYAAD